MSEGSIEHTNTKEQKRKGKRKTAQNRKEKNELNSKTSETKYKDLKRIYPTTAR